MLGIILAVVFVFLMVVTCCRDYVDRPAVPSVVFAVVLIWILWDVGFVVFLAGK